MKNGQKNIFFSDSFYKIPPLNKGGKKICRGMPGLFKYSEFWRELQGTGCNSNPGVFTRRSYGTLCLLFFFLPTKRPYRTVIAVLVPSGRLVGRNTKKSFLRSGRNVWYRSGDLNCTLLKPPLIQFFIYLNLVFAIKIYCLTLIN